MRGGLAPLLFAAAVAGCASAPPVVQSGAEVEVALDEGRASERPLTPSRTFEMLVRIDPKMPSYQAVRMRFLLAQPGRIVFAVYAVGEGGGPGATLKVIDRDYGPWLTSTADDGKWVVESLADLPVQTGPIFIGLSSPEKHSDPRLWASSNDSGQVFMREADPATPLSAMHIPRTPKLRVSVVPHI